MHPSHIQAITIGDEQRQRIETFCAQVDQGLETATYDDKLAIVEMLDVRGTIAIENNNEKVVYIKCLLEQQQRLPVLTSPSSSEHCATAITITARLVLDLYKSKTTTDELWSV